MSKDRIHLLRLPKDLIPCGLQDMSPKMSVSTQFQHWPAVVYSDVEDLLSNLPSTEQDVVRRQHHENMSHPESQTEMCARLFSWSGHGILRVSGSSLEDIMNDGSNDIIDFANTNIDDWIGSADSLIKNHSRLGPEVDDHARRFKVALESALRYARIKARRKSNDDKERDGKSSCESERDVVEGVESQKSASQSSSHPPANIPSTKSKGKCRRPPTKKNGNNKNRGKVKSKHVMVRDKKAFTKEHGSRVIMNRFLPVIPGVPNNRTCIVDSLSAHIVDPSIKQIVISSFCKMMPTVGDTPIKIANEILEEHGMVLQRATPKYQNGCKAFNLLKMQECRLIIGIRLYDLKKPTWYAPHCVAWDGKIIHDRPKCVRVNNTSDRTEDNSKAVFERLFHKKQYSRWEIVDIYELVDGRSK
jgi:hypothetical protein